MSERCRVQRHYASVVFLLTLGVCALGVERLRAETARRNKGPEEKGRMVVLVVGANVSEPFHHHHYHYHQPPPSFFFPPFLLVLHCTTSAAPLRFSSVSRLLLLPTTVFPFARVARVWRPLLALMPTTQPLRISIHPHYPPDRPLLTPHVVVRLFLFVFCLVS